MVCVRQVVACTMVASKHFCAYEAVTRRTSHACTTTHVWALDVLGTSSVVMNCMHQAEWLRPMRRSHHNGLVQRATAAQATLEEHRRAQQARLAEARQAEEHHKSLLSRLDPANACAPPPAAHVTVTVYMQEWSFACLGDASTAAHGASSSSWQVLTSHSQQPICLFVRVCSVVWATAMVEYVPYCCSHEKSAVMSSADAMGKFR